VKRAANEKASVFAAAWHSDWSFQDTPPAGTILHSKITPPTGGDTLFCNGYAAYEALSDEMKARIEGLEAIHSAALAYAPDGVYGANDGKDRSMTIKASDDARHTKTHPIVRVHPETGRKALFINPGYVKTVKGLTDEEAFFLLVELYGVTHGRDAPAPAKQYEHENANDEKDAPMRSHMRSPCGNAVMATGLYP